MDRYSMSEARAHLSELLDAAEQGKTVSIERKGTRFELSVAKAKKRRGKTASIQILDPSILDGWTWMWGAKGLELATSSKGRRKSR